MAVYIPNPEELGRRRFLDDKTYRKTLSSAAGSILESMQTLLASNYPEDLSTNLNILNRSIAREIARLNLGMNDINNDKEYLVTRTPYLQQILGERLGLGARIAPIGYNDETYRRYLLAIKSADLKGSKLDVIESLASEFTGQDVRIKELYLNARQINSPIGVSAANKMVVQVLIDLLLPDQNLNSLKDNLDFFINLVKPAHTLYDTEFIWLDEFDINKTYNILFGDSGSGCVPLYDYNPFVRPVLLAQQVTIENDPLKASGIIDSIHHIDMVFYLDNSTQIVVEPGLNGTKFYNEAGHQIFFKDLEIGQSVKIVAQNIPGNFQFWNYPSEILLTPFSQFYKAVYQSPLFQETVKKKMDAHGRFPLQIKTTPTTLCDRWVQDALQPLYEDLRGNCGAGRQHPASSSDSTRVMLRKRMGYPKLNWPFSAQEVSDPVLLGNDFVQIMEHYPLTDGFSGPALPVNISVALDGTSLIGAVDSVDASSGRVYLNDTTNYWEPAFGRYPVNGDEFTFSYNYLDGTTNYSTTTQTVYGISYWQLSKTPVVLTGGGGTLADKTDVTVYVDGTKISGAIVNFDPLLGHVTLSPYSSFWESSALGRIPISENVVDGTQYRGDYFKFDYSWGENYNYGLLFDEPARVMDAYREAGYPFSMLFDEPYPNQAVADEDPLEIGYRFRTYQLHHSSVLNSDTLALNTYQKPANRASIANKQETLNSYNVVFSPEFLTDTSSNIVLDDIYLENGLDPVLKLQAGVPPFQKTFSYQKGFIRQKKLQDIRKNHELLMYSDLMMKETPVGDPSVNLSSICDSDRLAFKTRYEDDVPVPQECQPWLLFDTVEIEDVPVSIPGSYRGAPNVRVSGRNLREDFVLRSVQPIGTASFAYSFYTSNPADTTYNLPATYKMFINDDYVDFPTLPIVSEDDTPATITDITCTLDGQPHTITGFNPTTGVVSIADYTHDVLGMVATLTAENIASCSIYFPDYIPEPTNISFTIGTSQLVYKDFKVINNQVTWYYSDLKDLLEVGDRIQLNYSGIPMNAKIEFTYHITNSAVVPMINRDLSRIMDNGYVFGGLCYDREGIDVGLNFTEDYTFIDDDSDGIKMSFFNKDTLIVEDHIFSGPVFEIYSAVDDEIGVPDNYPNALVKIQNPLSMSNPLNLLADYGFLNDDLVRFRKKTYKELLPDRSFRTMELVEMQPV